MKITSQEQQKDQTKLAIEKQVEKQVKYIGSVRPKPNQRCFEYNEVTKQISEAKFSIEATYTGGVKKKIIVNPDCRYIIALNKKNALRKV